MSVAVLTSKRGYSVRSLCVSLQQVPMPGVLVSALTGGVTSLFALRCQISFSSICVEAVNRYGFGCSGGLDHADVDPRLVPDSERMSCPAFGKNNLTFCKNSFALLGQKLSGVGNGCADDSEGPDQPISLNPHAGQLA